MSADRTIKDLLKDASLHIRDAGKAWPKYPEQMVRHLDAGQKLISMAVELMEERPPIGR